MKDMTDKKHEQTIKELLDLIQVTILAFGLSISFAVWGILLLIAKITL